MQMDPARLIATSADFAAACIDPVWLLYVLLFCFFSVNSLPQDGNLTFHPDTHAGMLAGFYFSAEIRMMNVSEFSTQLCWRAAARTGLQSDH